MIFSLRMNFTPENNNEVFRLRRMQVQPERSRGTNSATSDGLEPLAWTCNWVEAFQEGKKNQKRCFTKNSSNRSSPRDICLISAVSALDKKRAACCRGVILALSLKLISAPFAMTNSMMATYNDMTLYDSRYDSTLIMVDWQYTTPQRYVTVNWALKMVTLDATLSVDFTTNLSH